MSNAIAAYNAGATGKGIKIGIVDSGINPALSEFAGQIDPASGDVASNRGISDEGGHGTAVSAVAAAARNGSNTMGVAFDATIVSERADDPGSCAKTGTTVAARSSTTTSPQVSTLLAWPASGHQPVARRRPTRQPVACGHAAGDQCRDRAGHLRRQRRHGSGKGRQCRPVRPGPGPAALRLGDYCRLGRRKPRREHDLGLLRTAPERAPPGI